MLVRKHNPKIVENQQRTKIQRYMQSAESDLDWDVLGFGVRPVFALLSCDELDCYFYPLPLTYNRGVPPSITNKKGNTSKAKIHISFIVHNIIAINQP